ncbi:response regulator transcription factor [Streptomyces sp. NBC_01304]|uniref:response regulator transcription factor n=1 Tax=Streptomyces sp. NBC_01304 TaxID=2903818 RepID=UPI002E138AD2|nr:response regulator transcription factor [Streptomyces sp. NBC_01304]
MGQSGFSALPLTRPASLQVLSGGASTPPERATGANESVRVYVLGTDALARGGIKALLEGQPAVQVVGEGEPGPDALADAVALRPDVLLAHGTSEPELPPGDCRLLTVGGPEPAEGPAGCGHLPGTATAAQLASAVVLTAAGYAVVPHSAQQQLGSEAPGGPCATTVSDVGPEQLTERECEVLGLLARGLSNTEIADVLTLSEHTVKTHVQNLLNKLRLRNRVHAAIYAFETGLRPAGRPASATGRSATTTGRPTAAAGPAHRRTDRDEVTPQRTG